MTPYAASVKRFSAGPAARPARRLWAHWKRDIRYQPAKDLGLFAREGRNTTTGAKPGIPLPRRLGGTTIMDERGRRVAAVPTFGGELMSSPPDAIELLKDLGSGNQRAADKLMPLVYEELRTLAEGYFARERPERTLQPTALVHEAYLHLVDQTRVEQGKTHYKAVAAQAMHRALVDHARARDQNGAAAGGGAL